jgi:hypothetical protein
MAPAKRAQSSGGNDDQVVRISHRIRRRHLAMSAQSAVLTHGRAALLWRARRLCRRIALRVSGGAGRSERPRISVLRAHFDSVTPQTFQILGPLDVWPARSKASWMVFESDTACARRSSKVKRSWIAPKRVLERQPDQIPLSLAGNAREPRYSLSSEISRPSLAQLRRPRRAIHCARRIT